MTLSVLAIVISLIVGIISIGTIVWKGGGMATDVKTLMADRKTCQLGQVQIDIAAMKKQNETFWAIIQPHLASIIHSPEHKRRDELVDKLIANQIDFNELLELMPMLEAEANNGIPEKRLPAAILSARVQILLTRGP